ncbi:MAG: hypothetical protein QOI04_681 [Verrucomicrobiota bacterium]|jgi:hypothetical protein
MPRHRSLTWLLVFAVLGFAAPGGLFLYWALNDFTTLTAALHDGLALAFVADVLITTGALTVYFALRPPGPYRWPWFLALSLLGTLAFGLAMYLWLNRRTPQDDAT